jgi:hypothetical protein
VDKQGIRLAYISLGIYIAFFSIYFFIIIFIVILSFNVGEFSLEAQGLDLFESIRLAGSIEFHLSSHSFAFHVRVLLKTESLSTSLHLSPLFRLMPREYPHTAPLVPV